MYNYESWHDGKSHRPQMFLIQSAHRADLFHQSTTSGRPRRTWPGAPISNYCPPKTRCRFTEERVEKSGLPIEGPQQVRRSRPNEAAPGAPPAGNPPIPPDRELQTSIPSHHGHLPKPAVGPAQPLLHEEIVSTPCSSFPFWSGFVEQV